MSSSNPAFAKRPILGSVQFGLPYGVSNSKGQVPQSEVERILASAQALGITEIDSAAGYGTAESALGTAGVADFEVGSKFLMRDLGATPDFGALCAILDRSLAQLGKSKLAYWMIHDPAMLLSGQVDIKAWVNLFERIAASGKVAALGVSVYSINEANALRDLFDFKIVQMPAVPVSASLWQGDQMARLAERYDQIHGRSVLLQGLLAMDPLQYPAYFSPWRPLLAHWTKGCAAYGVSPVEAAVRILSGHPYIDGLVLGVTSASELQQLVQGLAEGPLPMIPQAMTDEPGLLDPTLWVLE